MLTDVANPLLGPDGAARVFAPQKGAAPEDLPVLERNLARFAVRLAQVLPAAADHPGAGAAGAETFKIVPMLVLPSRDTCLVAKFAQTGCPILSIANCAAFGTVN